VFRSVAISLLVLACYPLGAHARTRPHYGGILQIETQGDPWQEPDGVARRLVFDTLTRTDDAGAVLSSLAVRWESQNADHRWQFWLRHGVHFHDGTPLTAEAVVASLSQSCRSNCLWNAVRAIGDSVVFTCDSAVSQMPAELARSVYGIMREDPSQAADGTGLFRVTASANGVLSLAANEDSWQGRPFLDAIEIRSRRSIRDQWLDLSVGHADIVEVPPGLIHQAQQEHFTVLISRPADLLLLSVSTTGHLHEDQLRQAVALAVDRSALYQVIFQKQGKMTASLLPDELSGYAFLFPIERDLANARGLHGQSAIVPWTLAADSSDASIQLAAQRIELNLHEAGFNVQFTPQPNKPGADLLLRRVHLEATGASAGLTEMFSNFGEGASEDGSDPAALYRMERAFLQKHKAIPLLYLPRAYAISGHVRDLRLSADGIPMIGDVSLEDSK
jgi:peptide/nickel transport system substrate-binding protein